MRSSASRSYPSGSVIAPAGVRSLAAMDAMTNGGQEITPPALRDANPASVGRKVVATSGSMNTLTLGRIPATSVDCLVLDMS